MEVSLSGAEVCIFSFRPKNPSLKWPPHSPRMSVPRTPPWEKNNNMRLSLACLSIPPNTQSHKFASLYFMPVCMLICSLLVHQDDDLLYIGLEENEKTPAIESVTEWAVAYWILLLLFYLLWSLRCVWSSCMDRHDPASASSCLYKFSLF